MPVVEQWKINRWRERQHEWNYDVVDSAIAKLDLSHQMASSVRRTHQQLCDIYFAQKNRKAVLKKILLQKMCEGSAARSVASTRRHLAILVKANLLKIEDQEVTIFTHTDAGVVVWFPREPFGYTD